MDRTENLAENGMHFHIEEATFWATMESILTEAIPLYLKRMISAAGYVRFSDFKEMSADFKTELECFARTQMTMFEKTSGNFHIFHGDPREFQIVPGHWKLLCDLQKKLPENKRQFLKLQQKVGESALIADRAAESRRIPPSNPTGHINPSASTSSQASTSRERGREATGSLRKTCDEESMLLIQTKVEAWMKSKKLELELPSKLRIDVLGRRRASVLCFLCNKSVSLSTRDNKNGSWGWIVSNFTQHILQHASNKKNTLEKYFHRTARAFEPEIEPTDEPMEPASANVFVGSVEVGVTSSVSNTTVVPRASDEPASSESSLALNMKVQGTASESMDTVELAVEQAEQVEYIIYEEVYENAEYLNASAGSENPQDSSEGILQEINGVEPEVEHQKDEPEVVGEAVGTLKTEYN